MALNRNGIDLKAIRRDQKAIDKLPNHGLAMTKALNKKKETKKEYTKRHGDDLLKYETN